MIVLFGHFQNLVKTNVSLPNSYITQFSDKSLGKIDVSNGLQNKDTSN